MRPTLALAPLLALTLVGCGPEAGGSVPQDAAPAATLYLKARCDSCHGKDGQGMPRVGPPLAGIAKSWTRDELVEYLLDPAPFRQSKPHLKELASGFFAHMRPFPELDAEQRGELADWLLQR